VDRAGNPLVDPERSFEIKLGPYFEVSAFANPIHRRELKFHFKSLSAQGGTPDRLLGVPFSRITQSGGRAQVLDVKKVNDFVYAGIYTVDPTRPGTATVEVHGSDLEGNGITRRLTFNIQDVEPLSLSSIRGVSNAFYLNLPTRTVANRETFYVLSGDFVSGAGESPFGTVRDHELEPVINLGTILGQAAGAGIQARVDMEQVPVTVRRKPGLGLYKVLGDQITFLGGPNSSGSIEAPVAQAAGSYWLAADGKAPTIQVPDAPAEGPFPVDSARPRVSFSIEDAGSGLDSGTVIANLDGRRVMTIGTGSQGVVALDRDLSAGSHELVLSAADRSGNRSTRTLAMLVPNILEVRSFVPWPNPARMISNLRYELTQSAAQAQISIYDASGRRVLRLEAPTFAGEHDVVWDLTDRDGRPVGPGIYPVRLIVTFPDGERVVKRTKIAVSG